MKRVNEFLKTQFVSPSLAQKLTEEELSEALTANTTFINEMNEGELKAYFHSTYADYSLTLDCLLHWYLTLAVSLLRRFPNYLEDPKNNGSYFTHLLFTLTNNLIALKYLFENGLDTQAKSVFRNSIELSDLALLVLYDNVYFLNHTAPQQKSGGNRFISPKNYTLAKKAGEVITELYTRTESGSGSKKDSSINTLKRVWDTIRNGQYEVLSENYHGNYVYNILNAYKLSDENGNFVPSIGGHKWRNLDRTLSDICLHQIAFRRHVTWTLKLKHNIDLFDHSTIEHRFIFFLDTVLGGLLPKIAAGQSVDYIDIRKTEDEPSQNPTE